MEGTTFEVLGTIPGAVVAAAIVFAVIQLLKVVFPALDARLNGLQQAFILSAGLYVLTAIVLSPMDANGYLNLFIAWLSCATSAVGIHQATVGGNLLTRQSEPPKG